MRNPIRKLSIKALYSKRKMTLLCSISIILCVILLTSSYLIKENLKKTLQNNAFNHYGKQQAVIFNASDKLANSLKSSGENKVGSISVYYIVDSQNETINNPFTIGYIDDTALKLGSVVLKSGRLPNKSNEIAITESALFCMPQKYKLNDKIKLPIQRLNAKDDHPDIEEKEFVLVGVLNNFLSTPEEDLDVGYENIPSALIYKVNNDPYISHLLLYSNDYTNALNLDSKFSEEDYSKIIFNNEIYLENGSLRPISNNNTTLIIVFLYLLSGMGLFFLYSTINLFIKTQRGRLLNLRYIGASNSMLLKYILYQFIFMLMISAPIGTILGALSSRLIKNYVSEFLEYEMNFHITARSIIAPNVVTIIAITIIVTVAIVKIYNLPAVELNKIKFKDNIKPPRIKTRKPLLLWSVKSAFSSLSMLRFILSIGVCIGVFIGGIFMTRVIIRNFETTLIFDYEISDYDGMYMGSLMIPRNVYVGLDDFAITSFENTDEVKNIYGIKYLPANIIEQNNIKSFLNEHMKDETLSATKEDKFTHGYDESDVLYSKTIYGINEELRKILEQYVVEGNVSEGIIIISSDDIKNIKPGEIINFTQIIDGERFDFSMKVGAIVKLPEEEKLLKRIFPSNIYFSVDQKALGGLIENLKYNKVYVELKNPDVYSGTETVIRTLKQKDKNFFVKSIREDAQMQRNVANIFKVIINSLIIFTGIIGFFNFINHSYSRLISRKRELAMLRAVGMTQKQMNKLFRIEILSALFIAFIIGTLVAALFFAYCICFSLTPWEDLLPIKEIILTIIALFSIGCFIFIIPINRFFKETAAEQLRDI